jgi:hypothetical protein
MSGSEFLEVAQPFCVSKQIPLHAACLVSADRTTFILRTISCVCRQESQNTHDIETKQTLQTFRLFLRHYDVVNSENGIGPVKGKGKAVPAETIRAYGAVEVQRH